MGWLRVSMTDPALSHTPTTPHPTPAPLPLTPPKFPVWRQLLKSGGMQTRLPVHLGSWCVILCEELMGVSLSVHVTKSQAHLCTSTSTHMHINTHKRIYTQAHPHINTSTHKLFHTQTPPRKYTQTHPCKYAQEHIHTQTLVNVKCFIDIQHIHCVG